MILALVVVCSIMMVFGCLVDGCVKSIYKGSTAMQNQSAAANDGNVVSRPCICGFGDSSRRAFAILVTTNLVSQPCRCGVCNPEKGIAVPEHIGVVGYDLRVEVATNFLPVVFRTIR